MIDCIGLTFSRLTVIARAPNRARHGCYWRCRCVCGRLTVVSRQDLASGKTKSCGCWNRAVIAATAGRTRTHGLSATPTYHAWRTLVHAGRCPRRWRRFPAFLAAVGLRPSPQHRLRWPRPGHPCVWIASH